MRNANLLFLIRITLYVLLICFLFFIGTASALLTSDGIDPLDMEGGSRPLAMGGAFVGLADDLYSLAYNPGGLAWTKGLALDLRDINNYSLMQSSPTGNGDAVGFIFTTKKLTGLSVGTTEVSFGTNTLSLVYGTKFSLLPILANLSFAKQTGVGISIKTILGSNYSQTGQSDLSAVGWDMDLGFLYKANEWSRLGLSLQNILPQNMLGGGIAKWSNGVNEEIPANYKLGYSAKLIGDDDALNYDYTKGLIISGQLGSSSLRTTYGLGAELGWSKKFFFRIGYGNSALNYGLGWRLEDGGIDFAYYKEAVTNQQRAEFSFVYFPGKWILVQKLEEIKKPVLILGDALQTVSIADNAETYDEKIDVSGKVKSEVEVYINGARAYVDAAKTFKTWVPLKVGKNLIVVELRAQGEKKTWDYKVLRKAKIVVAEEEKIDQQIKAAVIPEVKARLIEEKKVIEQTKEKVEVLVTLGVVEVKPKEEFVLEDRITRGELATWIVKAAGFDLPEVKKDVYVDVPKDHVLAPYIKVVSNLELLEPFPDGTFRPEAFVSKKEGEEIFRNFGIEQ
ncbi:hypothetical protein A2291_00705 [candidate division WOR-1 bacterium RIFOXYB2_FULL_42_35]|uniref:SLH domain-containing protein n=1 Tax=candidate division WOR-1 bacterium RIFOXYC2_FULL_41_25 TaxID=1802586 RepID=A0A1F4TRY2_UNCSA|nr:MAG: hypothetical protein A2247_07930 [candidate division WOR-1 bacterium RIFOXYA2_FULL_41_14]OGC25747.1 MAG: hypothetical protein A2291_00705 [candidate division WOR-1 bacterium RIFOXYB2_FULL_42_35]OGC35349.1 MAG: hypothetical protein A2462_07000 [candidate division WOR-1 bacterium RIFOXYC2_FULL_41_25]